MVNLPVINILHHNMGGWLIFLLSSMCGGCCKRQVSSALRPETNQDPLANTFGVISLHCSNNNPTGGQFADALKTSIIMALLLEI